MLPLMNRYNYISIGKFMGTHGLRGELVLKHALGKKTSLKGLQVIFIAEKTGTYLPWFIENTKVKSSSEVFVKFENLNTREDAQRLVQKEAWLSETDFNNHAAKTSAISLLGHMIIDGEKELGVIEEVIEQPHQILCRLQINDKDVFIPLHEETLRKVDRKNKKVFVNLPEGLLDIYLE